MDKPISPYNFLKSRRSDEFSDSVEVSQPKLDKAFMDFYLNSLTSRSEEKKFENFCRRIAEYELCPNLLPQTGPTGGGDSKVDSETYPVSDDIALSWYTGLGREAASERWAFAFSAKKDWKSKIKSDVENIISTGRDYRTIYFMSNQYIPDKKRAAAEDEFLKQYAINVRILDRSWLLDKLFMNHNERIAVESFGLSDAFLSTRSVGPLDYDRKQKLDVLESEIRQLIADGVQSSLLVDKSIESAVLSRELELPCHETIGRFHRAAALANKLGTNIQQKECVYSWAWTLYWWHEEFDEFYNKYCEYEQLVLNTINVYDIERLTNLWMNLFAITQGDPEVKNFRQHTETLVAEYTRIIEDKNRPNSSLEAQANFVFVKLMLGHDPNELLDELTNIVKECEGVLDFSLDTISKMIMGIAPAIQKTPSFDKLFETIVTASSNRKQETVAAELLLKRGKQLIETKPYGAIRYIGRSLLKLYKEESKNELILALFLMGHACERLDLLWAARGFHLNAFYIGLMDYMKYGRLNPVLAACSRSIKMLELQQGRIPQLMEWDTLNKIMQGILACNGYDTEKLNKLENVDLFDVILGILFLRTPFDELHKLTLLPDALDKRELFMAAGALKYALGHVDEQMSKAHNENIDSINEFMRSWYNQPAKEQIPEAPTLGFENTEYLQSKVMGCQFILLSDRRFPCIELSESILAALESFLATGPVDKMISIVPKVDIRIIYTPSKEFKVYYQKEEDELKYKIFCSDFSEEEFAQAQSMIKKFVWEFLAELVARVVIFKDAEKQLGSLAKDDLVFNRSLDFTGSVFLIADLFGKEAFSIKNLITLGETEYPLKRTKPLDLDLPKNKEATLEKTETYKMKHNKADSNTFDPEEVSHKNIDVISIINIPLWNKAKWQGMMFAFRPGGGPPILSPMFTDENAARAIFKEWDSLVGKSDDKNVINLGLIKGINKNKPNHYKVVITGNINVLLPEESHSRLITMASRFHKMEPETNINLTNFENMLIEANGRFYLIPSYIDPKTKKPELICEYAMYKKNIEIKNAWEIGEDSWLSMAITPDDDPIIPPFVRVAPVNELQRNSNKLDDI